MKKKMQLFQLIFIIISLLVTPFLMLSDIKEIYKIIFSFLFLGIALVFLILECINEKSKLKITLFFRVLIFVLMYGIGIALLATHEATEEVTNGTFISTYFFLFSIVSTLVIIPLFVLTCVIKNNSSEEEHKKEEKKNIKDGRLQNGYWSKKEFIICQIITICIIVVTGGLIILSFVLSKLYFIAIGFVFFFIAIFLLSFFRIRIKNKYLLKFYDDINVENLEKWYQTLDFSMINLETANTINCIMCESIMNVDQHKAEIYKDKLFNPYINIQDKITYDLLRLDISFENEEFDKVYEEIRSDDFYQNTKANKSRIIKLKEKHDFYVNPQDLTLLDKYFPINGKHYYINGTNLYFRTIIYLKTNHIEKAYECKKEFQRKYDKISELNIALEKKFIESDKTL